MKRWQLSLLLGVTVTILASIFLFLVSREGLTNKEIEQLSRNAEQGDGAAGVRLYEYYEDLGRMQDAMFWLRKAAETGSPRAQYSLYSALIGKGDSTSGEEAIGNLIRAATQGYAAAQLDLGEMYSEGKYVEKDLEKARFWFRSAADQGQLAAMRNLSRLLADSCDDRKNLIEAYALAALATSRENVDAFAALANRQQRAVLEKAMRLGFDNTAFVRDSESRLSELAKSIPANAR